MGLPTDAPAPSRCASVPIAAWLAGTEVGRAFQRAQRPQILVQCTVMVGPAAVRKPWYVKYDGRCSRCGKPLAKGTEAIWDKTARSMHCVECPAA